MSGDLSGAPWRQAAIGVAKDRCIWAQHHDGQTCIEATDASAYWCLACKRSWHASAARADTATEDQILNSGR